MIIHWTCFCGEEIEVSVVINEEDDLPETCPACNKAIPEKAHGDVQTWACEKTSERPDFD